MMRGAIIEQIPFIKIMLRSGPFIQTPYMILDTGFTGEVQVTRSLMRDLQLTVDAVSHVQLAHGGVVPVQTTFAEVIMEGVMLRMEIIISNGDPLIGMGFLTKFGYRAIIDCKNNTVFLEK